MNISAEDPLSSGDSELSLLNSTDRERLEFARNAVSTRNLDKLFSLVEAYLTLERSGKKSVSNHTLQAYKRGLADLLNAWADVDLLDPGEDAGRIYIENLGKHLKPASVAVKLASAKAFYATLNWTGASGDSPFARVKAPKDKLPYWAKGEYYTPEEVARLIQGARADTLLIVLLGVHAGLSTTEMNELHWDHLDLVSGTVQVVTAKHGETVAIRLSPELIEALEKTDPRDRNRHVLNGRSRLALYKRLKVACQHAGVAFKGVHALRRSSGMHLLEETDDFERVADHLRHVSLRTAKGYAERQSQEKKTGAEE